MESVPELNPSNPQSSAKPLELVLHSGKKSSINSTTVSIQVPKAGTSCPICLDEYPEGSIIKIRLCKHFFCSQCLKEYLLTRVNTSKVLMIPCPQSGCNRAITKTIVKKSLDPEDYKRYNSITKKKLTLRDARNKFCPKPGCSKQLRTSLRKNYTVCTCGTEICNTCNNFRHEGKSCIEAIDPEFTVYSRDSNVRFCIVCKTPGRKESGCNHIKCPACDFDWCWTCGREFSDLHICPYHWSPISPRHWEESSVGEKICFIGTKFLRFPLDLLRFLLLWPLYEFFKPETDLTRKKPIQSFLIILLTITVGIAYSPYILLYVIGINIVAFFCFMCRSCFKTKKKNSSSKRWMTGDVNQFSYFGYKKKTDTANDGRQIEISQQPSTAQMRNLEKSANDNVYAIIWKQENDKGPSAAGVAINFQERLSPKLDKVEALSVIQEESHIHIEIQG